MENKKLYIPKEVYEKDVNLGRKLYALGKACDLISANMVQKIISVPAFLAEIKDYRGEFTNEDVFQLLSRALDSIDQEDESYALANKIVSHLDERIHGIRIPDGYEDCDYLHGILSPLKKSSQRRILTNVDFLDAALENGPLLSLKDVYDVYSVIAFSVIADLLKQPRNDRNKPSYYMIRSAITDLSSLVFGNPDQWRIDYAAHFGFKYRPPLVSKNQSE